MLRSLLLPPRDHLRPRVVVVAVGGCGAGGVVGGGLGVGAGQPLVASERERLAQQASVIHDNLARQLQSIDKGLASILNAIAQTRGFGARPESGARAHSDPGRCHGGGGRYFEVDGQGRVQAGDHFELIGRDLSSRAYFQTAKSSISVLNTLIVGEPFAPEPAMWVLPIVRPVVNAEGGFDGVVVVNLPKICPPCCAQCSMPRTCTPR